MRIRKRQVLFPSSLSPLPLSDPHLINRSPVMVQLGDATSTVPKSSSTPLLPQHAAAAAAAPASSLDHHQPSDQPLPPIGKLSNGWDHRFGIGGDSGAYRQHNKQDPLDEDVRGQESEDSREKDNNHARKGRVLGSEVLLPASPSSTQDGRWCNAEKAIPLKKRRGSFENGTVNNNYNSKKMKARMKTKMNKKCSTRNDDYNMEHEDEDEDEDEEEEEEAETKKEVSVISKRRARGSALMEGSRCSRVNGRGWRCCQQTLVGYSLCEHHLGKGRLRSMTSVRSRSIVSTTIAPKKLHDHPSVSAASSSSSSLGKQTNKCVTDEKKINKPLIITKKRMKLGMVKARSMSSLLGQTSTQVTLAHENNK
ncbi:uncharacterized protein LOC133292054 [Gastrolobium bilobum]|uniref:uncharacterized protein LOC133292054 n=1 Tax=Gastrolobium bilobum TaxID=150636 RepID=UPI002AAF9748|nr:uncharacterized protein LOC133292054 [Gastrolobium bilobum]